MRKNKMYELIKLIYRCSFVFFFICFMASIIGSILVFFEIGYFKFVWRDAMILSAKKGIAIGVTLGVGLWIKSRLQERKG